MAESLFCMWLSKRLKGADIDADVFANYIVAILTSEETEREKQEALELVLDGLGTFDVSVLCDEIWKEWEKAKEKSEQAKEQVIEDEKHSLDVKLAVIMEKQAQPVLKPNNPSESEKKLKEAILAQYSQVSDDEDVDDAFEESGNTVVTSSVSIPHNENVEAIVNAEKEQREKAKAESEKKKAQDKLNKEKQKQKQQERREKERKRTQKGEHRR